MEENEKKTLTLREIREQKPAKSNGWFHQHMPFLFHPGSVFYYAIVLYLVGFLWAAYPMFTNSFTQLLNWDYTWQYIPFTYVYWDAWHTFFTTGHLPLYDAGVFLGTDMIGSGSYYGLFDPFMFICYLFPRAWIPQMYAQMTFVKIMTGGLFMRAYLKKMGIREWTARFGGVIYALSGYTTFFMGSPNFTSAMAFLPLILLGIEKVIRDQKFIALSMGIFLLGISCFFYVPVICIYGVIYALWRFFSTFKTRTKSQQFQTMGLGVAGFAIGLLLSAFSFIPSMRETLLSGRSSSIGSAYLGAIKEALKSFDMKTLCSLIFEEVGDNPGRELMGLISFFFPAGGWYSLPLARGVSGSGSGAYDAWTACLFCYTPGIILFFSALIHSIRLKKWNHLLVVALCIFAVFTNFSYFFFYAFSGNGYGRWYLVLVPLIVYYACWGFDQRKEGPAFVPVVSAALGVLGTVITFYTTEALLHGVTFSSSTYNTNQTTYWISGYKTASDTFNGITAAWYFYYQLSLLLVEGVLYCIGQKKRWMPYVFFGFVCVEAVVMGNASYAFMGTWSYKNSFAGGESTRETSLVIANAINSNDDTFFRAHSDVFRASQYAHNVAGLDTPCTFHSLMNFDVEPFALMNQMKYPGSVGTTYNETQYYNPKWSGFYGHKRYSIDTLLGYRYYVVENNYSAWKDSTGNPLFLPANVPFDCEEMESYSPNRNRYRVYKRGDDSLNNLGYAVDSDLIYYMGVNEKSNYRTSFFDGGSGVNSYNRLQWAEHIQLNGAIVDDDVELPSSIGTPKTNIASFTDTSLYNNAGIRRLYVNQGLRADYYETATGDGLLAGSSKSYYGEGLGYFLNHYEYMKKGFTGTTIKKDIGKLCFCPSSGEYFNTDPNGCYFEFRYLNTAGTGKAAPRIYAIGDTFDENGNVTATNVCLSFDHYLISNADSAGYYQSGSCTYGLYAPGGRVKQFVLCYPGAYTSTVPAGVSSFYVNVCERSDMEAREAQHKTDSLHNVVKDVNTFTFDTAYETDRVVVTQLGFDKGWGVTATLPNGQKKSCQMLRLNGGLVGFVAPSVVDENGVAQTVQYVMEYKTPYSNLSAACWIVGMFGIGGIVFLQFHFERKNKKKQQEELMLPND